MRRTGAIFLGLLLALLLASALFLRRGEGPRFQGRSASFWFEQYLRHAPPSFASQPGRVEAPAKFLQAERALQGLGTNLVPYLVLVEMPREKPRLRRRMDTLQHSLPHPFGAWHQDWNRRWHSRANAIAHLLSQLRPPGSLLVAVAETLVPPEERAFNAIVWLARFCGEEKESLLPVLADAFASDQPHHRVHALLALQRFGPDHPEAVQHLIGADLLHAPESLLWLRTLGGFGPNAQPALPRLEEGFEQERRGPYLFELARAICLIARPEEPLACLAERLLDTRLQDSPEGKRLALSHLRRAGPEARPALPILLEFLDTERETALRIQALNTLRAMEVDLEPILGRLLARVPEIGTPQEILDWAIETWTLEPGNAGAVSILTSLLQYERSEGIRAQVLSFLETEGAAAQSLLPVLETLLEDPLVRNEARRVRDRISRALP